MIRWTVHSGVPQGGLHIAVTAGDKVYAVGWYKSGLIGVRVFNTVTLRWRDLPPVTAGRGEGPSEVPPFCHTAVLIEDIIYTWGGYYSNVLYAFDVDTHRWLKPKVTGTGPEARHSQSAVLGKVMYVCGYSWRKRPALAGIYKLDTTTMVWTLIGNWRSPLHSATIIGTKLCVIGGSEYTKCIRVFDTETNSTSSAQNLPEGVHAAFAYNGDLYICGVGKLNGDMWKFNTKTFSWVKVKPKGKGPRCMVDKMHCCTVGDRVFLFCDDDLYILDWSPSLKTLCKLATIRYGLKRSEELPHNIRWELAAMTTNSNRNPKPTKN